MSEKAKRTDFDNAARIVRDAGGKIVGRTRLQKMAYLLELARLGDGFPFHYKHYGPYSEVLSQAIDISHMLGMIDEKEEIASWGGRYSIYKFTGNDNSACQNVRSKLLNFMTSVDPVELELAATAAFLSAEGVGDPWSETARRKPDKSAGGRIEKAKALHARLREVSEGKIPLID